MGGHASPYAVLGLEPGADSAEIDRAYKRLIKQHHPDREGGDSKRAAEITNAYRELRARPRDALELHDHQYFEPRNRNFWFGFGFGLAGAVAGLWLLAAPFAPMVQAPQLPLSKATAATAPVEAMDEPLNLAAVDGAVRDAQNIARTQDEMGLSGASQACHHQLRTNPTVLQLDRCAAFDDAVVQLQNRDPLRDRGPFGELAVTGRQWSGASALSNDYLAIDGRLDRIRLRVELALAADQPSAVLN